MSYTLRTPKEMPISCVIELTILDFRSLIDYQQKIHFTDDCRRILRFQLAKIFANNFLDYRSERLWTYWSALSSTVSSPSFSTTLPSAASLLNCWNLANRLKQWPRPSFPLQNDKPSTLDTLPKLAAEIRVGAKGHDGLAAIARWSAIDLVVEAIVAIAMAASWAETVQQPFGREVTLALIVWINTRLQAVLNPARVSPVHVLFYEAFIEDIRACPLL